MARSQFFEKATKYLPGFCEEEVGFEKGRSLNVLYA